MFSLSAISNQTTEIITLFKAHMVESAIIVGCLWGIHILNVLVGMRLNVFGLWPRRPFGLIGIFTSPLLHGDFNHLLFNSIPLFLLIDFMLVATGHAFWYVTLTIVTLSGIFTWIGGRKGIHVGASGVVMGYWGFLLTLTVFEPTVYNIIIVVIMLYYLGGLVFNLFPSSEKVSFEGHIYGAIAGGLTALLFLHRVASIF